MNIGVRLGKWSKVDGEFVHVIDLDIRVDEETEDAERPLEKLLAGVKVWRLPRVKSGSNGASRHIYFTTDEAFPSKKLAHSGKKFIGADGRKHWTWEIELFGTGKQVAIPPSIHPDTGKRYLWEREFDESAKLPHIDADLIADLVFAEDEGEERETEVLGITYKEAEQFLNDLDLDYWCEDREGWRNVGMALHHEFDGSKEAFAVWVDFSKNSRKFELDVCRQQWKSFKATTDKPIRMASVVKAANESRHAAVILRGLRRRGLALASVASSVIGLLLDSLIFIQIAFGNPAYIVGQSIGKAWMVLAALPLLIAIQRKRRDFETTVHSARSRTVEPTIIAQRTSAFRSPLAADEFPI